MREIQTKFEQTIKHGNKMGTTLDQNQRKYANIKKTKVKNQNEKTP
jgi:hypothetical protein